MADVDENVDMEENNEQEGPLEVRSTIREVYIRLRLGDISSVHFLLGLCTLY
jgi:hypothetical protein